MEETIVTLFLSAYGLFFLATVIILIFLIIRRIKIKKQEKFEDRSN